jgi:hypothetical protein
MIVGPVIGLLAGAGAAAVALGPKAAPVPAAGVTIVRLKGAKAAPKAATAPGVTAGGQATDVHGNKVGPSGKNQAHTIKNATKKGAKDAARNAGKGKPVKHASPAKGDSHYHPTDENGDKIPNSPHFEYSQK